MVQRLPVVDIDGTSYCLQCHGNGVLTPVSNQQDDTVLCPAGEEAAWEEGTGLSWEEYTSGASCRGCGQPLLTAREAPGWHAKGTMYYTEDEQAEAEVYEAEFRARHPLCHAFRWTLTGRLGEHCMRCCPPPPLSPEQMMAVLSADLAREVAAKAAELDDAAAKYDLNLAPFDTAAAQVGPSVIRYRTRLLGKQTIAGVRNKALDLGREIGVAEGVLVDQEPYFLTVDVPRRERVVVPLAGSLDKLREVDEPGSLPFLLGVAPSGEVRVEDLARLPHLLVAGATGSGKNVLLRGLLCSVAWRACAARNSCKS